jgi:hypothetical protein
MVTAIAAVCGEALAGLLGAMLSDPRVTWPAIKHVLPVAAVYDVLLCPFVLYAVAAALRLAGTPGRARATAPSLRAAAAPAGLPQATPRLRLSQSGRGDSLIGRPGSPGRALAKREPHLKLGHGGLPGAPSLGAAFTTGGAAKVKFGTGRGGGGRGSSLLSGAAALSSSLAGSGLAGSGLDSSRFGRSRMGRSLLGGSVFSRSPSALRSPAPSRKAALMGRSSFLGRSPLRRSSSLGRSSPLRRSSSLGRSSLGHSSSLGRSSAPGLLGRLAAALRRPARHQPRLRQHQAAFRPPAGGKSPGRGWLGSSSLRRGRPGRGLAAGRGMPGRRTAPARLRMRRSRFSRRWRTGGYR